MRRAKRAKSTAEPDPLASAGRGVATDESTMTSPQPSPLQRSVVPNPPTGAGAEVPPTDLDKGMEEAY